MINERLKLNRWTVNYKQVIYFNKSMHCLLRITLPFELLVVPTATVACLYINGVVQERCNSSALAMELLLSFTNPSICFLRYLQEICPPTCCVLSNGCIDHYLFVYSYFLLSSCGQNFTFIKSPQRSATKETKSADFFLNMLDYCVRCVIVEIK